MRFTAALMLISFTAFGQTAPPEVDQVLRARVDEFYGYHVTGKFMKAYELVAEDTKEYYFAVQKNLFLSFKVGDITYSDNFTKAVVNVVGKQKMRPRPEFPEVVFDLPMKTTWKIEDGKWVWYLSRVLDCPTPMSCGPDGKPRLQEQVAGGENHAKLPDLSAAAIGEQAQQILKQSKVDKPMIAMTPSRATSEYVVFHNGQPGGVRVFLDPGPTVEGFTASIAKNDLKAYEDVTVTLHYEPGKTPPPPALTITLNVEPLHQAFPITVKFGN
jgi:hypothetical protein